mmetsp:Transcript_43297/g.123906  ORF Transcript_43297/g.123906 Transcript_43297/m.123906 type:complete len:295 (-) Transcript_43297:458-1342(-)
MLTFGALQRWRPSLQRGALGVHQCGPPHPIGRGFVLLAQVREALHDLGEFLVIRAFRQLHGELKELQLAQSLAILGTSIQHALELLLVVEEVKTLQVLLRAHPFDEASDEGAEGGDAEEHPEGAEDLATLRGGVEEAEAHGAQGDDGHVDGLKPCFFLTGVQVPEENTDDGEHEEDTAALHHRHLVHDIRLVKPVLHRRGRNLSSGLGVRSFLSCRQRLSPILHFLREALREAARALHNDTAVKAERKDDIDGHPHLRLRESGCDIAIANGRQDLRQEVHGLDDRERPRTRPVK